MLYKIKDNKIELVNKTRFNEEEKLEKDLENWIENNPPFWGKSC